MTEYHKIQTIYKRDPETNHKTLLEGCYSLPEFEYLANNMWVFTEKVDGTNIRVIFDGDELAFGGKTDNAQIPTRLLRRLYEHFLDKTDWFIENFPEGVCLYGEGYGAKIQKGGGNYRSDQDFVLFDVKVGKWWLKRKDIEGIASALNIDVVPIVSFGTLQEMIDITRDGFKSAWGNFMAEGIVARPSLELYARSGERIITKIKHKDFGR